jgi:3-keto-5-aminohexanoate cleavage enzyme
LHPLIIMVAPNGARRTRADHAALPLSNQELAATAVACRNAGAAMIHLHVRDAAGHHTLEPEAFRTATAAIRGAVGDDLIIQATSEAMGLYPREEQMDVIRSLRPESVSMAINEFIPDPTHESSAAAFFAWVLKAGICPQYILYSAEEVSYFHVLRSRGIIPGERPFVLFVLGRYSRNQESDPWDLPAFLSVHDPQCPWAVCAFGRQEAACTMAAIGLQGHTRVGFENNLVLGDGALAPDNAALVAQNAGAARLVGRPLADAHLARKILFQKSSS